MLGASQHAALLLLTAAWCTGASDQVRANKKTITVQHYPKAGGSTVVKLLKMFAASGDLGDSEVNSLREFQGILSKHAGSFKIGLVRDPCEYYVSLWAFGVRTRGGLFALKMPDDLYHELYGSTEQWRNISRFGAWLSRVLDNRTTRGVATLRWWSNYVGGGRPAAVTLASKAKFVGLPIVADLEGYLMDPKFDAQRVDCWARTQTLLQDLRVCLKQYEAWVGQLTLRWDRLDTYLVAGAAGQVPSKKTHRNTSPHLPCARYYDDAQVRLVAAKDPELLRMWNFTCCGRLAFRGGQLVPTGR